VSEFPQHILDEWDLPLLQLAVLYAGTVVGLLGKFALHVFDSIAIIHYSAEFVANLY
jgi:hypothetical protein